MGRTEQKCRGVGWDGQYGKAWAVQNKSVVVWAKMGSTAKRGPHVILVCTHGASSSGQVAVQGEGWAHATTSQAQVHLERGPVLPDELQKVEHGFAERMWCALMLNEGVQTADTFLQSPLKVHQQPVRYREQCVGVSRPKQTVKNVRQAVVVHQVAEDAESEAIVVI